MKSLTPEQRTAATLRTSKTGNDNLTEAFKDNVVLDYAGVPVRTLNDSAEAPAPDLIGLYVHNMRDEPRARAHRRSQRAHWMKRTSRGSAAPSPTRCSTTAFTAR